MKNRLIALIDFSAYSHALAELATRWSEVSNARLVFVHQVAGIFPALADEATRQEIIRHEKDQALEELKTLAAEKGLKEDDVQYVVTEYYLLNTVRDLLKEGYNDVVLVGVRGAGMLRHLLMGNTATTIVNEMACTVVAVPDTLCAASDALCNLLPRRLVVALSHRFPLNEKAFDDFLDQYRPVITQLEFISSVDDPEEEEMTQYVKSLAEKYHQQHPSTYRVFKGKEHFKQVMVQRGSRTLTDRLFRRFLVNDIVHEGSLPLVVLP